PIIMGLVMAMLLFMKRISEVTKVSVATGSLDLSHEGEIVHQDEVLEVPQGVEVYEIDGPFFFGAANKFDAVMGHVRESAKVRVIRMRKVPFMDTTGIHNLEVLIRSSQSDGVKVILSGVNDSIQSQLRAVGVGEMLGSGAICSDINEALSAAKEFLAEAK
ncbi:MAG: sodium-independent anion transporter, partial [Rikenellaceae bacterium]